MIISSERHCSLLPAIGIPVSRQVKGGCIRIILLLINELTKNNLSALIFEMFKFTMAAEVNPRVSNVSPFFPPLTLLVLCYGLNCEPIPRRKWICWSPNAQNLRMQNYSEIGLIYLDVITRGHTEVEWFILILYDWYLYKRWPCGSMNTEGTMWQRQRLESCSCKRNEELLEN